MSDSLFNTWKDAIFEQDSFSNLNRHIDQVVAITSSGNNGPQVIEHLRTNDAIVLLGQSQVSGEILLVHHLTEISGGIGSSFKAIVCLQGFGIRDISFTTPSMDIK